MKEGIILGLTKIGCTLDKEDQSFLYFTVPKSADREALKAIATVLKNKCGLGLKAKYL